MYRDICYSWLDVDFIDKMVKDGYNISERTHMFTRFVIQEGRRDLFWYMLEKNYINLFSERFVLIKLLHRMGLLSWVEKYTYTLGSTYEYIQVRNCLVIDIALKRDENTAKHIHLLGGINLDNYGIVDLAYYFGYVYFFWLTNHMIPDHVKLSLNRCFCTKNKSDMDSYIKIHQHNYVS